MKYEDFIEEARTYRKTFKYFFTVKDIKNKWILLLIATQAIGLFIYVYFIPPSFERLSDAMGMAVGLAIVLSSGLLRNKFDKEKLNKRLFNLGVIRSTKHSHSSWELNKLYLKKICLPKMSNINILLDEVKIIEGKIFESQGVLDNVIGFSIFERLFSFKKSNNSSIFTAGVAVLSTAVGMYLEDFKIFITDFYETPADYLIFCVIMLLAAVLIIMIVSFLLGMLGVVVIRYVDLHDKYISRYARHQFKVDLLMLAEIGTSKKA